MLLGCNSSVASMSLYKSSLSSEYSYSNYVLALHVVAVLFGLDVVVVAASG